MKKIMNRFKDALEENILLLFLMIGACCWWSGTVRSDDYK